LNCIKFLFTLLCCGHAVRYIIPHTDYRDCVSLLLLSTSV